MLRSAAYILHPRFQNYIFLEEDQCSISESQNFSYLSWRNWARLEEIRSNICRGMSAATSQLSGNTSCHTGVEGSTADARGNSVVSALAMSL